jgi:predicted naringenin-chalcone synthase
MMDLLPQELPESVRKNLLNLGVSTRYFVRPIDFSSDSDSTPEDGTPVTDLSASACRQALAGSGFSPNDIDYLVATYDSSAFLCPGLSNLLISQLGLKPNIKHVSIQGMACSAFSRALQLAEDHLARFQKDRVMLSFSGANSHWFYNQVRGLNDVKAIGEIRALKNGKARPQELRKWIALIEFFLFGDGAACAIMSNQAGGPQFSEIVNLTNVGSKDYLAGYAKLTGLTMPFKFDFYSNLSKNLPELGVEYTKLVLDKLSHGRDPQFQIDAKKWIVHTGSKRILDQIVHTYGIDHEKVRDSYDVLSNYGNLAGASLPFILGKILGEGALEVGDYAIALGFGWGFNANASVVTFQ